MLFGPCVQSGFRELLDLVLIQKCFHAWSMHVSMVTPQLTQDSDARELRWILLRAWFPDTAREEEAILVLK